MFKQLLNMFPKALPHMAQGPGAGPWATLRPALQKTIGHTPDGQLGNEGPIMGGGAGGVMFEHSIEDGEMLSPAAPQLEAPRKRGLAGFVQAAGDRAAKTMYGDQAGAMRDQVWGDLLGSIGDRMTAGGTLGQGINDARAQARAAIASRDDATQARPPIVPMSGQPQPPEPLLRRAGSPRRTLSEMTSIR